MLKIIEAIFLGILFFLVSNLFLLILILVFYFWVEILTKYLSIWS